MASIKTYARVKPADDLYDDYETTRNRLYLRIPDSYGRDSTLYNRTRAPIVNHEFKYSQVFGTSATQEEVFNISTKNIIDGFLEGYNGTIFAYGQTSSGKTYTMQGDLNDSKNKGLTPRSLTRIFNAVNLRKKAGENISMHCSFLEIYQEVGYDLLKSVNKAGPSPASFAKVTVVDGPEGAAVVKNLSIHSISSEEAAQALLAQGESNRKVAETAMNNRSSRSHAVFTVYLSSRKGDLLVRSKMHFVDLAGSERVCKTGVKGLQLSEAKYINLSLHYLEGVIIALHQHATASGRLQTAPSGVSKSWANSVKTKRPYSAAPSSDRPRHIPYRNSLLTMLLKDSLGGNCLTSMIATISLEMVNLSESISTCRFAQRVSCISNTARKNEEIDDKSMIKRLRTRVAELEAENNVLKHGGQVDLSTTELQEKLSLTQEDKELCQHVVKDFLNGRLIDPIVAGVTDPFKFRECMSIFKRLIKEHSDKSLRLTEKLKQQPMSVQEAFYTGGKYYEAPLAKPVKRQEIIFRDDANALARRAYYGQLESKQQKRSTSLRPTILNRGVSAEKNQRESPTEAWQLQLYNKMLAKKEQAKKKQVRIEVDPRSVPGAPSTSASGRPKPQSAAPALRRTSTPFEKKKIHEVKLLNKQVEENYVQQVEQTNHLRAFKKSVIEEELELSMQSLKRKIEVTQHQLFDQQKYVLNVKQQRADEDLIIQEQLVEQQLQKRVNKLLADLNATAKKLQMVKADERAEPSESSNSHYHSVQDKFANVTKKDGTIDRIKVMTTLEQQQKLQNQLQKKIDQQRALVIDKHLEVKEQSTRQKLEEFKRKLAESSSVASNKNSISSNDSTQRVPERKKISPSDSQTTFQSRIKAEKQTQKQSIGNILSRYRAPSTDNRHRDDAEERTAQVDRILAKYRKSRPVKSPESESRKASTEGKQTNPAPYNLKSRSEAHIDSSSHSSPAYRTVTVANSSMKFKTANVNRQTPHEYQLQSSATKSNHRPSQVEANEKVVHKDFDATLKAMLLVRQGHHQKRTEAWKETKFKNHDLEKNSKADLLRYLSKQHKKKQQERSAQDVQSNLRKYSDRKPSADSKTKPKSSRAFKSTTRDFSHRPNYYQHKSNSKPSEMNVEPRKELLDDKQESSTTCGAVTPNIEQPTQQAPKVYANLMKRNEQNKRTSKIRQIQNATLTIQRAWRRYCKLKKNR